jgi:rhodanese-related sulfurtransferase|tara:strand:- start:221 stop:577 length:357 start_codon:yes stop_codon:yes gene_type:complete
MDIKIKKLEEMILDARSKVEDVDPLSIIGKEDQFTIIDVREPNEVQETGMVLGAHNIPRGLLEFQLRPSNDFPADAPILVYCAVGARAALAGVTLKELGFTDVKNLGGFKDWQDASKQ